MRGFGGRLLSAVLLALLLTAVAGLFTPTLRRRERRTYNGPASESYNACRAPYDAWRGVSRATVLWARPAREAGKAAAIARGTRLSATASSPGHLRMYFETTGYPIGV